MIRRIIPLFLLLVLSAVIPCSAQAPDFRVLAGTPLEQQYEEMLHRYLLEQAKQLSEKAHAQLNAAASPADFTRWQTNARNNFLKLIGGLPREKTQRAAERGGAA
jgi:hypothetical protein